MSVSELVLPGRVAFPIAESDIGSLSDKRCLSDTTLLVEEQERLPHALLVSECMAVVAFEHCYRSPHHTSEQHGGTTSEDHSGSKGVPPRVHDDLFGIVLVFGRTIPGLPACSAYPPSAVPAFLMNTSVQPYSRRCSPRPGRPSFARQSLWPGHSGRWCGGLHRPRLAPRILPPEPLPGVAREDDCSPRRGGSANPPAPAASPGRQPVSATKEHTSLQSLLNCGQYHGLQLLGQDELLSADLFLP